MPLDFFENSEILPKIGKNRRKSQNCYLEKGVLKLCRDATIKPRQIEHPVFFSTGPNLSLQTGLRSTGLTVVEKMRFSYEG